MDARFIPAYKYSFGFLSIIYFELYFVCFFFIDLLKVCLASSESLSLLINILKLCFFIQGRCLCGHYIKRRLRRSGLFNKKLGLQRIRSILGNSNTTMGIVRDVFPAVQVVSARGNCLLKVYLLGCYGLWSVILI